jgi:hypothetical protein
VLWDSLSLPPRLPPKSDRTKVKLALEYAVGGGPDFQRQVRIITAEFLV